MLKLLDVLLFTLERLWEHRILVFWTLIGLAAATTLALSLILYVDAVNTNLLASRLNAPPYGFRFRYLGAWNGNITQDDVNSGTAVALQSFPKTIGLPAVRKVALVRSIPWTLTLDGDTPATLGAFSVGTITGIEDQITIIAGEWPAQPDDDADGIPVLLPETMLYTMGVEVGDTLELLQQRGSEPIIFHVAALWRPVNAAAPDWIFPPKFFDQIPLLTEADFWSLLEDQERPPVEEVAWQIVFDGQSIRTSDVSPLLQRIVVGERDITTALPGTRMDVSPVDGLKVFVDDVNLLTQQLVIIILPVGGLVLYFVTMVAGLLVSRQVQEDVVLRSRGMSRRTLLGVHIQMWMLLAGIALLIGLIASPFVVQLIGRTTSFLRFDGNDPPLAVTFTAQSLMVGAFTALLAASSGLFLAWRSTRQNINSFKRSAARASTAWWQRAYLDIIFLIPGAYVYYTLTQQGGLKTEADNPFADPLTFIGPTLFALGVTLLFLRVWPFLLRIGAALLNYTRNISLLMALRELNRSIGRYRGTLLMMCFTLSLTGLTASMASTIDQSLRDSINYKIGADAVLVTVVDTQAEQDEITDANQQQTYTVTGYNTLPAADLLAVDGVAEVSRVGHYSGRLLLRSQRIDGTVLGIDRASIAAVTRARSDFADTPFADLFNLLAGNRTGVIMNRQTMVDYNLLIGQEITLQVSALGEWYETTVPISGVVDYFPTLDPENGFFLITNIDPIWELVGTELPHDIWLSLKPGSDLKQVEADVRELGFPVLEWLDPQATLAEAQAEPSRRGVLGFLSVGFVASIFLTLVGTIIQNTVSFRAQSMQLGSLRAMGLGSFSVASYLIILQGIAASSGILGGTSIGVVTTLLFLPLLDFSGGLPPYLVRVAWDEISLVYGLFAGVLFFVTVFTTILISREQLSTVVKLGDV